MPASQKLAIPIVESGMQLTGNEKGQRMYRDYLYYTDQHGRIFGAISDTRNMRPVEELHPLNCMPPWQPDSRFVHWTRHRQREFTWDYHKMALELAQGTAAWYANATKMALAEKLPVPEVGGEVHKLIRDVFGNPYLSPEIPLSALHGDPWLLFGTKDIFGDPVPRNEELYALLNQGVRMSSLEAFDLIETRVKARLVKTPDAAAVQEAVAQMAQHPEVAADARPESLPSFTYQDFMREGRKNHLTLIEIATAWKAHKAAMAEAVA